ncbi:MAG: acyl carrier protein [Desulfocurvibacter africanus]|uniref:acyl carrier protein n=1 Tax=Desulfocurvibacter africanus TaxID=873 RepID=UPI00042A5F69|nr:acyl carrier protein [Desulfocurvibacter africanus]
MSVTREDLKKLLLAAGIKQDVVKGIEPDVPLTQQGVDSVDYPSLLETIKERLGVEIANEDACSLKTLSDFEKYLNKKK